MQCGRSCTFRRRPRTSSTTGSTTASSSAQRFSAPHGQRSLRRAAPAGSPRRAGIAFWTGGDIYWTHWLANDPNAPYPSFADLGYLGFFPFAYVGFILLVRVRVPKLTPGVWLDGITAGLAVGALSAAVVLQAVLSSTSGNLAAVATNLAYPLGDALLLALIVGAFPLTSLSLITHLTLPTICSV
jgi:hypothetical protein